MTTVGKWAVGTMRPGERRPWRRGGFQVGETSSWHLLEPGGSSTGRTEARSCLGGQACVDRQSWLPFLALPFVSSVTLGSDCTSLSQFPSLK